ncbi:DUF1634 domain-containing protein [Rhodococcus sp. NPDC127593]|uniref:DUF1634 domain-containing protein n=1 Tax=Rhodococcus sp. NPDC127593 TaxID=3345404 RepID=UPI003632E0F9
MHSRLARLWRWGTAIATAVTAFGMMAAFTAPNRWTAAAITCGLLLFTALPVAGLILAVNHFARRLDWVYAGMTVGVLVVVAVNVLAGSVL